MAQDPTFTLLGLNGDRIPELPTRGELKSLLEEHRCFAGGKRQYELLKEHLPEDHEWITVRSPIPEVMKALAEQERVVVFVSGDPFFYGFGRTIRKHFPEARIRSYPGLHSLQLLAQELGMEHGGMKSISLHGRARNELYSSLLKGHGMIGVLTDEDNSPDRVAEELLEHGYGHYRIHVGERLGGSGERIRSLSLAEAGKTSFDPLNCLILESTEARPAGIGHPDEAFEKIPGRPGMITKRAIRTFTLSALDLSSASSFWDIGTCTGSMAIEANCMFPELRVSAIEKKEEAFEALERNIKAFGTPGIELIKKDVLDAFGEELLGRSVDRIFLGGHGGDMERILQKADDRLNEGGLVALNAIQDKSAERFREWINRKSSYTNILENRIQIDGENPITVLIAQKRSHDADH